MRRFSLPVALVSLSAFLGTTAFTASAAANAAASRVPANWTEWAFNAQHTGYNPNAGGPAVVARLKPVFATRGVGLSDPIVVNGTVYLTDRETFKVQAVDAATGAKLWSRSGCIQEQPTDPAYAGGSVWVALDDPGLAAVSASGTRIRCISFTAGGFHITPPSAARGRVYSGSEDGFVTAADAVTGQVLWSKNVAPNGTNMESPTVSLDGRFLFVAGDNGILYKLDSASGKVLWSRFIDTCAHSAVSVTASLVYVGGCNLYALSQSTGRVAWRASRFGPDVTTPAIVRGEVLAATVGGSGNFSGVAAFNATTGKRVWFDGGYSATVPLTAAGGVVYVNEGSDIAMIKSGNGAFINYRFAPLGSTFAGSMVPAARRVYVCTVAASTGVATLRAYQPEP